MHPQDIFRDCLVDAINNAAPILPPASSSIQVRLTREFIEHCRNSLALFLIDKLTWSRINNIMAEEDPDFTVFHTKLNEFITDYARNNKWEITDDLNLAFCETLIVKFKDSIADKLDKKASSVKLNDTQEIDSKQITPPPTEISQFDRISADFWLDDDPDWFNRYWKHLSEIFDTKAVGFINRTINEVYQDTNVRLIYLCTESKKSYRMKDLEQRYSDESFSKTIDAVLESESFIVVSGSIGAGKRTNLIRKITKWSAKSNGHTEFPKPIILDLITCFRDPQSFKDILNRIVESYREFRRKDPFAVQKGIVWIFLDLGVTRQTILHRDLLLQELSTLRYDPTNKIIISIPSFETSLQDLPNLPESAPLIFTEGFTTKNVRHLLRLWDGREEYRPFLNALMSLKRQNYILPRTMAIVLQSFLDKTPSPDLISNWACAFQHSLNWFFERWMSLNGCTKSDLGILLNVLEELAYMMYATNQASLGAVHVASLFPENCLNLLKSGAAMEMSLYQYDQERFRFLDPAFIGAFASERLLDWLWDVVEEKELEWAENDPRKKLASKLPSLEILEFLRQKIYLRYQKQQPKMQKKILTVLRNLAFDDSILIPVYQKGLKQGHLSRESDRSLSLQIVATSLLIDISYRLKNPYNFGRKQFFIKKLLYHLFINDVYGERALKVFKSQLRGGLFDNANFEGLDLREADLSDSHCNRVNFKYSYIYKTSLEQASLKEADFSQANLCHSNMARANLQSAKFYYSQCIGTNFEHCELKATEFNQADLKGSSFRNTKMGRVKFMRCNLEVADFENAVCYKCDFEGAYLWGCNFLNGAISASLMRDVDLSRAILEGIVLENVDLRGSNFRGAVLKGAKISNCNLEDCDFRGAFFDDIIIEDSSVQGMNLIGSKGLAKKQLVELMKHGVIYRG